MRWLLKLACRWFFVTWWVALMIWIAVASILDAPPLVVVAFTIITGLLTLSALVSELLCDGEWADTLFDTIERIIEYGQDRTTTPDHRNPGTIPSTGTRTSTRTRTSTGPLTALAATAARASLTQAEIDIKEADMEVIKEPVPILAKRAVAILDDGTISSVGMGPRPIKHLEKAICLHTEDISHLSVDEDGNPIVHNPPEIGCGCGFYAVTWDYPYNNEYRSSNHWAEVELSGKVLECQEGEKVLTDKTLYLPSGKDASLRLQQAMTGELSPNEYLSWIETQLYRVDWRVLGYRAQWQRVLKVHVDFAILNAAYLNHPFGMPGWYMDYRVPKTGSVRSTQSWREGVCKMLEERNPHIKFVPDDGSLDVKPGISSD